MTRSVIFCEHANEVPMGCPCDDDCYCKEYTCKPKEKVISKSPIACNHANEMPVICPCDDDCYCKEHSCKPQKSKPNICKPQKSKIKKQIMLHVKRHELEKMLSLNEGMEMKQISVTENGDLKILVEGGMSYDVKVEEGHVPPTVHLDWLKVDWHSIYKDAKEN